MSAFRSAVSPAKRFAVFFEDDGRTGWFYLMDQDLAEGDQIIAAKHVYDGDRGIRSRDVRITWSPDSRKATLRIRGEERATFELDLDAFDRAARGPG